MRTGGRKRAKSGLRTGGRMPDENGQQDSGTESKSETDLSEAQAGQRDTFQDSGRMACRLGRRMRHCGRFIIAQVGGTWGNGWTQVRR
jgi:hypothetical protein